MHHRSRRLYYIFLVVISLCACSRNSSILPVSDSRIISSGTSFGQSFTAQNNGLSAVSVLLAPVSASNSGSLTFHLRENSDNIQDIAVGRLPLSDITEQKYYKFDFAPQINSQGKDYFLQVDVDGGSEIKIFTSEADSYLDGALYEGVNPQEAQLGFQLEYDRGAFILGLIPMAFQWIGILVASFFVFVLPGWAAFSILWGDWNELNWPSKLGLSCGLSIAIYPVIFLWTGLGWASPWSNIRMGTPNRWSYCPWMEESFFNY